MYLLSDKIPGNYTSNGVSNNRWHKVSSSCSVRHLLRDLKVKRDGKHHLDAVSKAAQSDAPAPRNLLLAGQHIAEPARGTIQQYADCRID